MANDYQHAYLNYHINLLDKFIDSLEKSSPFDLAMPEQEDRDYLQSWLSLKSRESDQDDQFYMDGQQLITRLIARYSHLTPTLPRDLLWFFGGDCLHYLTDEEITGFQTLDDEHYQALQQGEEFHREDVKNRLFNLH